MSTPVRWTGRYGEVYWFSLYPIETEFWDVPGNYVICQSIDGNLGTPFGLPSHTPLYTGMTQSLYDRLNAGRHHHEGFNSARALGANTVAVRFEYDAAARKRIETSLRHSLRPPCNQQPLGLL